ncbi:hypothetical protein [Deinococcus sp. PESE-13]
MLINGATVVSGQLAVQMPGAILHSSQLKLLGSGLGSNFHAQLLDESGGCEANAGAATRECVGEVFNSAASSSR